MSRDNESIGGSRIRPQARLIRRTQTFVRRRPTSVPDRAEVSGINPTSSNSSKLADRESLYCCLSRDGSVAIQSFEDGKIGVWNTSRNNFREFSSNVSSKPVRQVSISQSGEVACATFFDGKVLVFSTETLEELDVITMPKYQQAWGCAISADGNLVFAGFTYEEKKGELILFDRRTKEMSTLWEGNYKIYDIYCSHDGKRVMFLRQKDVIVVLDIVKSKELQPVSYSFEYMKGNYDAAMDAKGNSLVISEFKTVMIHKLLNGGKVTSYSADNLIIQWNTSRKCDISADGTRFIEMKKRNIIVRDASDGKRLSTLSHSERLSTCRISADGKFVIAVDLNAKLISWTLDTLSTCDIEFLLNSKSSFESDTATTQEETAHQESEPAESIIEIEDEDDIKSEDTVDPTTVFGQAVEHFEESVDGENPIATKEAEAKLEKFIKSQSYKKKVPENIEKVVNEEVKKVTRQTNEVDKELYGTIAQSVLDKLDSIDVPKEWIKRFDSEAGANNKLSLHQSVSALIEMWQAEEDKSKTRYSTQPSRLEIRRILIEFNVSNDLIISKEEFLNSLKYIMTPSSGEGRNVWN